MVSDGATLVATRFASENTQAATLYYAEGGSFERVASTQRASVDGAELGKGSMSARGTSVAGGENFTPCRSGWFCERQSGTARTQRLRTG